MNPIAQKVNQTAPKAVGIKVSNRGFSPLEMAWRSGISLQVEETQNFAMPADMVHVPSLQIRTIKGQKLARRKAAAIELSASG